MLIGLLLIVEVGLVVRDALALVQAAREGARAAAVFGTDDAAETAVRRSAGPLEPGRIEVDVVPPMSERERGTPITVTLRYEERLRVPIVSRIASLDLPLRAAATMRSERASASPSPPP